MNKSAIIGIVAAAVCALAICESARIGFARTAARNALRTNDTGIADRAVRLLSNDAEVHAARGIVLQRTENYPEAVPELERAIQLRPRDYFLWMMLGVTRDLNDDQQGAVAALHESVALAPAYAKPHWLLGNLLLRMDQADEAFKELRFAAHRDPSLLPNVIDLAWGISHNDAAQTVAAISPQTDSARLSLAIFLAAHKQGTAAIDQFHDVKSPSLPGADRLMSELIESKFIGEAFEVWNRTRCAACKPGSLINESFEDDIDVARNGFGWRISPDAPNVTLSVDTSEHESGARSLRLDFHGSSNSAIALASQIVIVEPATRYRLSFQAKTKSFVSAGAAVVKVIDASDESAPVLG
ncbi:MAG TPA: tetratricopeptide repeat protein, partial [Pyrinomonadaceae bacterium]|nr:tetratricopeptide repeat protein [Pyrinomonadaceae bacterium]